ncbi:MAG: hypothetical protein H6R26_1631, partial [Proteobacteria bacterium]|nr:hypothetical protein [Pseudomonadota bacterium]
SGGPTGVDRAALDVGLAVGLAVSGWCPQGRRAEDGVIPARYPLTETPEPDYAVRTRRHVEDSDGDADPQPGQAGRRPGVDRRPRLPDWQALPRGGAGSGDRAGGVPGLAGRAPDRRLERRWSPRAPTPRRVGGGGARSGSVAAGRVPARGRPFYTPRALPESVLPHPFTVGEGCGNLALMRQALRPATSWPGRRPPHGHAPPPKNPVHRPASR